MNIWQTLIMTAAVAAGMLITRFAPFVLFPENKNPPDAVIYLGKVLPPAMMGLLFVYCMRRVSIFEGSHGIPEAAAVIVIVILQKFKGNTLLSIAAGTAVYIILKRTLFANM